MSCWMGARIEVGELKKDPRDFVLWKSSPDEGVRLGFAVGLLAGRAGISNARPCLTCCLGDNFDIHGGGSDLLFPHHENEVAQIGGGNGLPSLRTCGCTMGHLESTTRRCPSRLDNFFTVREVLRDLRRRSSSPFAYCESLSQSDQLFRAESAASPTSVLERFYNCTEGAGHSLCKDS